MGIEAFYSDGRGEGIWRELKLRGTPRKIVDGLCV